MRLSKGRALLGNPEAFKDATVVEKIGVKKDAKALEQIPSNGDFFFLHWKGILGHLTQFLKKLLMLFIHCDVAIFRFPHLYML